MWECNNCSELLEEQYDACWSCGVNRNADDSDPSRIQSFTENKKIVQDDLSGNVYTKVNTAPLYVAIFTGTIFIVGLLLILPDFRWWQQKQRGYWGHDEFSGLKSFMSSTSDGTAWVLGLGVALFATIIALFAYFNEKRKVIRNFSDEDENINQSTFDSFNKLKPNDKSFDLKSQSNPKDESLPSKIRELSKLYDEGLISKKEFEEKKKDFLDKF